MNGSLSTLTPLVSWTLIGIAAGAVGIEILVKFLGGEEDRRAVSRGRWIAFTLLLSGVLVSIAPEIIERTRADDGQDTSTWSPFLRAIQRVEIRRDVAVLGGLVVLGMIPLPEFQRSGARFGRFARAARASIDAATMAAAFVVASRSDGTTDSTWTGPLWIGNSASMALAALIMISLTRSSPTWRAIQRLESLDRGALLLQGISLAGLALGQGPIKAWGQWPYWMVPAFVVPVSWLLPSAIRRLAGGRGSLVASLLVLIGGIALRFVLQPPG